MSKILIGNFKGPKGDTGAQGPVGPKGEQGVQGPEGPAGGVNSVNGGTGDVVIGGRNLLHKLAGEYTSGESEKFYLGSKVSYVAPFDSQPFRDIFSASSIYIKPNTHYTLSLYIKGTGTVNTYMHSPGYSGQFIVDAKDSDGNIATGTGLITHSLPSEWKKYSVTWLTGENVPDTVSLISVRVWGDGVSEAYAAMPKLEEGTVATDWSPAPEDNVNVSMPLFHPKEYTPSTVAETDSIISQIFSEMETHEIRYVNIRHGFSHPILAGGLIFCTFMNSGGGYGALLAYSWNRKMPYIRFIYNNELGNWYQFNTTEIKVSDELIEDSEIIGGKDMTQ